MSKQRMRDLIDRINVYRIEEPTPTGFRIYHCEASPPVAWNKNELEAALHLVFPPDVQHLWELASMLNLFEGEGGSVRLYMRGPHQVIAFLHELPDYRRDDLRAGDLVIGNFLEEDDLLLVRCDPERADYGFVVEADTLDRRDEWLIAAHTLEEFLQTYLDTGGVWFWAKNDAPACKRCEAYLGPTQKRAPVCL